MKSAVSDLNFRGLTKEEVGKRVLKYGYNELPSQKKRGGIEIALGIIREPMFILLVICGSLYLILGDIQEGIMLMSFVLVVMGIEYFQERKTERALDALKDLASPRALVIRDGETQRVPGRDIVPGDLVVLQEGDRVPADGKILYCVSLLSDESLLTGESVPVRKREWTESDNQNIMPGGDELPYIYSGSMIVQGNGVAEITSTGKDTEIGKIGKALESVEEEPSKLKKEMRILVKRLAIAGVILCITVIAIYTLTRGDFLKGFLAGITLAMAMLPEEFPVVLTIFLALGGWRMSKRAVLARKSAAIEILGSATILCTDKTGTLTCNKMTVKSLSNGKEMFDVDRKNAIPEQFHEIIEYGILSSQVKPFDPMEKAIILVATERMIDSSHIHDDWVMEKEYPLSREMMAMSRVFSSPSAKVRVIAAKGAPEAVFDLCHLDPALVKEYEKTVSKFAKRGLRVLGVAKATLDPAELPSVQHDFDFEFVGLIALSDPVRESVPEAISECRRAGIKVMMITGDYPVTAINIGKEIGLKNPENVITGQELHAMSEEELRSRIKDVSIFARVVPEQKLKIVNALRKEGEVVAMTGDGVNDAPALKAADIGIAMGEKGTDVAREASSLVLLDDNFSSVVGAVRMGRRISDNLQKALSYIFAIHVPIAGLSLIPVFFADLPLILWPVHIVFLELIIDPACSIIFEAEREEKNIMMRPPRDSEGSFFGAGKIILSSLQGLGILIITMGVYLFGIKSGWEQEAVRAATFITLISSNIAVILSNRSWSENIFTIIATPNKTVKWVVGGAILFLLLIMNVPFLLDMFQMVRIPLTTAIICAALGFASIVWFELYKLIMAKRGLV